MISNQQFNKSALFLGCEAAAIKAVAEVESGDSGFNPEGWPTILFEPHQFWRELKKVGINPKGQSPVYAGILYEKWRPGAYGPSSKQHARLQLASTLHRDAALQSASWGKFQIMGYHWKACGCESLQEFINAMYESEDKQLELFCHYLKNTGLDKHLQKKDWKAFARGYNGAGYATNKYDLKLAASYAKFKLAA